MGPAAQIAFRYSNPDFQKRLRDAMHVHIDASMFKRISDLSESFPRGEFEGLMPHHRVFIEGHMLGEFVGTFLCIEPGDPKIHVYSTRQFPSDGRSIGEYSFGFEPKSRTVSFDKARTSGRSKESVEASEEFKIACELACAYDLLLTFMAEPRFVIQEPVSKLKRRIVSQRYGKRPLNHTWVKLGWTIGSTVRAKTDVPGSAPAKAFHMVRAHWRNYGDRRTPKAVQRAGRDGWWVWVDSHFSGNPALGEIKHHYQPKLDETKSARVVRDVLASKFYQTHLS